MEIKYWAGTDVGRKRTENEDNFLIDKRLRLFVVADGMGGHASGEIASAMAVHGIREVIDRERDIVDTYDDDDPKSHVEVCTLLEYAVHYTCAQIFQKARREPEKRGMGTTLVVLLFIGARGFIAYVGDSRIYLLRGSIVYQLTEDHSLRNELIRMGKITADEFESSPYANLKNAMTRAVGVYESVEVDTLDFDVIPGDSFLLCSDGLYEYLSDDDIANAIGLPEIQEVPGRLIDTANTRGGKDNITAVVVQVAGDDDDLDRAAELNFTLDTLKNVPLFRELSYQQLVRVMNLSDQNTIEPGQVLFNEGDPGHELYVVLRGRIELTCDGVAVAEVSTGAHLGEMSLVDADSRSATATALEPGKVLSIGRDDFYDVLRREPALAVKLLWSFVRVLAERLRRTTADLATARTSTFEDLTDLAEEAARSSVHMLSDALLHEEDEEDALENRRTLISGTVVAASPDAPTRAEPQAPPDEPPAEPPVVKEAPVRVDPRRTLISTTTSDVARKPSAPPSERSTLPGEMDVPQAIASRAPGRPTTPQPVASASARREEASDGHPAAPTAIAPTPSNPIDARSGAPSAVPPAPSNPVITGATVVPESAPRPPSQPNQTGDTVVPTSANPRPTSGPTNLGHTVVPPGGVRPPSGPARVAVGTVRAPSLRPRSGPSSIDATMRPPGGVPVPPPPDPSPPPQEKQEEAASEDGSGKRSRRRATLPQMPGAPPPGAVAAAAAAKSASGPQPVARHEETIASAMPPPPPDATKRKDEAPPRGVTQPSPTVPAKGTTKPNPRPPAVAESDAPQAPAKRRVKAAPQASPTPHAADDRTRVGVPPAPRVQPPPPPRVPPPPPSGRAKGPKPPTLKPPPDDPAAEPDGDSDSES